MKTPSLRQSRRPMWPPLASGHQPDAQHPTLHHSLVKDPDQKKHTNKCKPCTGVKHHDTTHKVVIHANIHGVHGGDGGPRSFTASAGIGLPKLGAASCAPSKGLLGSGAASFTTGSGLLLPGVVDFVVPRAFLASRLGSRTLVNARCFRIASWRSLSITVDATAAILRP